MCVCVCKRARERRAAVRQHTAVSVRQQVAYGRIRHPDAAEGARDRQT
jgi:hypothetical protein